MSALYRWLYRAWDTRAAARVGLATAATMGAVTGSTTDGWLSAFERRFVRSGWPGHATNWVNLHASRFLTRMRREKWRAPAPRPRRASARRAPLRVGLVGRFSGLLGFPPQLFAARPAHLTLVVFDVSYSNQRAGWLRSLSDEYHAIDLDDDGPQTANAARTIGDAELDLLVNINWKRDAYHLLDQVHTGCVANYCVGSDLLHHPRVDIELVWQMQPDNEIRHGVMWCTQSELPISAAFVYQIAGFYDQRGLAIDAPRHWRERKPLIVSHGSLYKFAVPEFVDCMLDVLEGDQACEWILVGKDNGQALARVRTLAGRRGVESRVHYEGEFSAVRNEAGEVVDPRWARVQDLLRHARVAPDPFPIGSGSARFEAYILGAPSPHMMASAHTRRLSSCELPVLSVPPATVSTVADYRDLCLRCLDDEDVVTRIQDEQLAAARRACDPVRWWQDLEAAFHAWTIRTEAA